MNKKGKHKKKKNTNKKENINEHQESLTPGLHLDFKLNNSSGHLDLFDYCDANNIKTKGKTTDANIFYCKDKDNRIISKSKHSDIEDQCEIIFRARKSKNNYYELIYPIIKIPFSDFDEIDKLDRRMWYVFKSKSQKNKYENKNEDYFLSENDVIKFGTAKYEIIKIHKSSSSEQVETNQKKEVKFGSIFDKFYPEFNNEEVTCDICGENSSEQGPNVKFCKCNIYMHYKCLKKKIKVHIKENEKQNVTKYTCVEFNCSKCKSPYPLKFYINFDKNSGKESEYSLIDLNIPEDSDYIILEKLNSLNENKKNIKNIFVVKLEGGEITIGSIDNNDIILGNNHWNIKGLKEEESNGVSKEHCFFKYDKEKGLLTIIDKSSYGTSILIKDNAKLENNKELYFQRGKLFISAKYIDGKGKI